MLIYIYQCSVRKFYTVKRRGAKKIVKNYLKNNEHSVRNKHSVGMEVEKLAVRTTSYSPLLHPVSYGNLAPGIIHPIRATQPTQVWLADPAPCNKEGPP